jgi:uncharacterized protein YcaQ
VDDVVRLLAPFDPLVWDRVRFELLFGWEYRFEAYTPAPKRKLGYYAMPLLWRDQVIGWANAKVDGGVLDVQLGYVSGKAPREAAFRRALEEEVERLREFLGVGLTSLGQSAVSDERAPTAETGDGATTIGRGSSRPRCRCGC